VAIAFTNVKPRQTARTLELVGLAEVVLSIGSAMEQE
jgi:hypothetical protein